MTRSSLEKKVFAGFVIISVLLLLALLASTIYGLLVDTSPAAHLLGLGTMLQLLLLTLIFFLICFEIRERRRMAEALKTTSSLQRAILDSARYTIISTNPQGVITTFNSTAEKLLGYQAKDLIGKTSPALLHDPAEIESRAAELGRLLNKPVSGFETFVALARQGKSDEREWAYLRKDGTRFPVLLSITRLENEEGEITGFLCVGHDITDRKRFESQLGEARDGALESARLKAEFLANMSHEIRTPMNGVIGMTELLLETELDKTQLGFAQTIRQSAQSLLSILNDILDFSKIEAGKLGFETYDFDLRDVVEGTLELLSAQATSKSLKLASTIESNVPLSLRGDAGRLRQVVTNLVSNAIKFTEKGAVTVRVSSLQETAEDVLLKFVVSDTGIGIDSRQRELLFQAFSQADGSTTRKFGGTGLGLAISLQLVERMQGEINFESEPGKGSTFWFTARLAKQAQGTRFFTRAQGRLGGLRVLLLDDNPSSRKALLDQLTGWRIDAEAVPSAAEAMYLARQATQESRPFAVLLIDAPIEMAKKIGTMMKGEGQTQCKIILLHRAGEPLDPQQMGEAGLSDAVAKPVRQTVLFDCLANAAGVSKEKETSQQAVREKVTPLSSEKDLTRPWRILVAEDNQVNQVVILAQLRTLGLTADVVANGTHVLDRYQSYDLILMDGQMPEMDGFEATRRIRERESQVPDGFRHPLYIVATTANAMEGDREICLSAGMDDYLSKPITVRDLKGALERAQKKLGALQSGSDSPGASATASPVQAPDAPIDLQQVRSLTSGDPEQMKNLMELFFRQTRQHAQELEQAAIAGNAEEVRRLAHKCAGSCSTCGASRATHLFRELESTPAEAISEKGRTLASSLLTELDLAREFWEKNKPA